MLPLTARHCLLYRRVSFTYTVQLNGVVVLTYVVADNICEGIWATKHDSANYKHFSIGATLHD